MASTRLNFSPDNLITGINIIDGMLYWTDDRNEPRSLEISRWRNADHSAGTTRIYGRVFENRDITVIRPHPHQPITLAPISNSAIIDRPFKDIFPRFSYRWRYNDGKYSPYAPFTQAAFIAEGPPNLVFSQFNTPSYSETEAFQQGLNPAMDNAVTSITLRNIPVGGLDVESIDILYTESISSTVYVIQTITTSTTERTAGMLDAITIEKRSLQGALPENQLNRPFDNVPRRAKAQEITTNRLLYGNYLQGYDQPDTINTVSSVVPRTTSTGLSVKTNRTYEIGTVFLDEFGRQGGLITSNSGSVSSPFFGTNRLGFQVAVDATASPAPTWATHFRHYIKDTSNPHFNLVSTDSYFDTSEAIPDPIASFATTYIWMAFNSKDRNKITDETVLVPKRHNHGNTTGILFEGQSLHPVVDIENEIPETLLAQAENTAGTDEGARATARQVALSNAQGKFFVKIKRATDPGSGGGDFLSTGESDLTVTTEASSAMITNYRITNLNGQIPAVISYTDANSGTAATITVFAGTRNIESRTSPTVTSGSATVFASNTGGGLFPTTVTNELNQIWFETLPIGESQLDLYWETSDTFSVDTDYGNSNALTWGNCYVFPDILTPDVGTFIESTNIRDEFNTTPIGKGVRVNTPQEDYREERRSTGIIYSGLFNDRTGVNRLNEFITSEGITKEIEPNYGSIQKLHTRDTNVIVFCEDKCFRVLADKDQLTNVDGSTGNVAASNVVLGQTTPFEGEYGIGLNPESFATYGYNIFFADKAKGVILQLTPNNGQFFEMSSQGMSDFFRDRLRGSTKIIGGFDEYFNNYIVSVQGYDPLSPLIEGTTAITGDTGSQTVIYDIDTRGWISRASYIPEGIVTLNNRLYTWNNGKLYLHNSNALRNNFYGTQYNSEVEVIFNTNPSVVKEYISLSYEGSDGWTVPLVSTDSATSDISGFVEKEGKYFSSIVGTEPIYTFVGNSIVDTGRVRETGGMKGFYAPIRFANNNTTEQELFSINTIFFNSSN